MLYHIIPCSLLYRIRRFSHYCLDKVDFQAKVFAYSDRTISIMETSSFVYQRKGYVDVYNSDENRLVRYLIQAFQAAAAEVHCRY